MSTPTTTRDELWVAGADGIRRGWLVVLHCVGSDTVRVRSVQQTEALFGLPEAPAVLAVDMVIGCPDQAAPGGRVCDRQARSLLGRPRSASVFSPPAYSALTAETYDEAQRRNRESGPEAPGLSKQSFHLFPKIRDLADLITPERQSWMVEVHPELAFYAMNGDASLIHSKHTESGVAARRQLLAASGFPVESALAEPVCGDRVDVDDRLDACAACWTARGIREGSAERCPPVDTSAPRNERGLRMEIWR